MPPAFPELTAEEQRTVETYAQEYVHFLQVAAEDAEVLASDPTQRDRLLARQDQHPESVAPRFMVEIMRLDSSVDRQLALAREEMDKLTPPRLFKDRMARLHLAQSGAMLFLQAKLRKLTTERPHIGKAVRKLRTELMDVWYQTELPRIRREFPPAFPSVPIALAAPARPIWAKPAQPAQSHPSGAAAKLVSAEYAAELLRNPSLLIGKEFVRPPSEDDDEDEDDREVGLWKVMEYKVRISDEDGAVEHNYEVAFESLGYVLPMGPDGLQELLERSTYED